MKLFVNSCKFVSRGNCKQNLISCSDMASVCVCVSVCVSMCECGVCASVCECVCECACECV